PAIPGINPALTVFTGLTGPQATLLNTLLASGVPANLCAARSYAYLLSVGAQTGLNGTPTLGSPNFVGNACPPIANPLVFPAGTPIGPRFLLTGAPIPLTTVNSLGQPIAFRALNGLQRVFPIMEGTTFSSLRLDHNFNPNHHLSVLGTFNPSLIT